MSPTCGVNLKKKKSMRPKTVTAEMDEDDHEDMMYNRKDTEEDKELPEIIIESLNRRCRWMVVV